jgi:hypothetical protein
MNSVSGCNASVFLSDLYAAAQNDAGAAARIRIPNLLHTLASIKNLPVELKGVSGSLLLHKITSLFSQAVTAPSGHSDHLTLLGNLLINQKKYALLSGDRYTLRQALSVLTPSSSRSWHLKTWFEELIKTVVLWFRGLSYGKREKVLDALFAMYTALESSDKTPAQIESIKDTCYGTIQTIGLPRSVEEKIKTVIQADLQLCVPKPIPAQVPNPCGQQSQPNLPTLTFNPIYKIGPVTTDAGVQKLKDIVQELPGMKFHYNEEKKCLFIGYEACMLKALRSRSKTLSLLIGSTYRNCFEGYFPAFEDKTPGLKNFELMPKRIGFQDDDEKCYVGTTPDSDGRTDKLKQEAKAYFHTLILPEPRPIPPLPRQAAPHELLQQILQDRPGICIGESHCESAPKELLCTHFKDMKELGVTTLFLEHLPSESLQEELDEYMKDSTVSMPIALSYYLENLDRGFYIDANKSGFLDVVTAAKKAGLKRIIAIDTELTYRAGTSERDGVHNTELRCLCMNYSAYKKIMENNQDGKFVAFVGSQHVDTVKGAPGLAQLLGIPRIVVRDSKGACHGFSFKEHTTISDGEAGHGEVHADIEIQFSPSQKVRA